MFKRLLILSIFCAQNAYAQDVSPPQVQLEVPRLTTEVLDAAPNTADNSTTNTLVTDGLEASTSAARVSVVDPLADEGRSHEEPIETEAPARPTEKMLREAVDKMLAFLKNGGPSIWAIAALSVVTVALIFWKIWRLALLGAWSRGKAGKAVAQFEAGQTKAALKTVHRRRGIRSKVVSAALIATTSKPEALAREETTRVAKRELAKAAGGLRALELIASIAPLLGLLGTVLGMIAAFQALQQAGSRADPSLLAGGIWEALLTTAAGMAVAIPASAALTYFEAVLDRIRRDIEDAGARIFIKSGEAEQKLTPQPFRHAAE